MELLLATIVVFAFMSAAFLYASSTKDNSIADVCWGIGYLLVALVTVFHGGPATAKQWVLTATVAVWAIRLAGHIALRNRGKGEDRRYAAMRRRWKTEGHEVLYSFLFVFMLQGALILIASAPVILTNARSETAWNILNSIGLALWIVGILFETVADYQLSHFKKTHPGGGVMQTGLWKYTRHPNYFGEAVLWWGIFFMAVQGIADVWLLISPLLITFLLVRVSGVPMAEERRKNDPEFAEYARRTNAFIPGPPR